MVGERAGHGGVQFKDLRRSGGSGVELTKMGGVTTLS